MNESIQQEENRSNPLLATMEPEEALIEKMSNFVDILRHAEVKSLIFLDVIYSSYYKVFIFPHYYNNQCHSRKLFLFDIGFAMNR